MPKPSFSLVIPFYRNIDFLVEAYKSALAQTLAFDEIIIVNDGSTEVDHHNLIELFPAALILSQSNHGPSKARNSGFLSARSDYVCFLDSDDLLSPHYLSIVSSCICFFDTYPSFVTVKYLKTTHPVPFPYSILNPESSFSSFTSFQYALSPRLLSSSSLCVQRQFIIHHFHGHLFPSAYRSGEDVIAALRLLSISNGIFINHPLSVYRVHDPYLITKTPFASFPNIFSYLLRPTTLFRIPSLILLFHLFSKACLTQFLAYSRILFYFLLATYNKAFFPPA